MIKLRLLLAMMCVCVFSAYGQDIIIKTDGTRIEAKVTEVSETSVKYLRHDSPEGPLYTIAVGSIANILYANGMEDTFNMRQSATKGEPSLRAGITQASEQVSDAELLRLVYASNEKVNRYKRIAWIGGGILAAGGITIGCCVGDQWGWSNEDLPGIFGIMAGGVVGGGIWWGSWLIAANRIAKNYHDLSASIIEWDVLNANNSRLSLGINVMGNSQIRDRGFGASVTYTF